MTERPVYRNREPVEVWHRGKWRKTVIDTSEDIPGRYGGIYVAPFKGDAVGWYPLRCVRKIPKEE